MNAADLPLKYQTQAAPQIYPEDAKLDTYTPPTLARRLVNACTQFAHSYANTLPTRHAERERIMECAEGTVMKILAEPAAEDLLGRLWRARHGEHVKRPD